MNIYWQISLLLLTASVSFVITIVLRAIANSIAVLRFNDKKSESKKLKPISKKIMYNSQKVGVFTSIGIRLFVAIEVLCVYIMFLAIFNHFNISLSLWSNILIAIFSLCGVLFTQFVFADLPTSAKASKNPFDVLDHFSKPFYIFYLMLYPFEFLGVKIAEKIFGKDISDDALSFDYIDLQVKLRAEHQESDTLTPDEEKIVKNSIRLSILEISDVMIPRSHIQFIDANDQIHENLIKIKKYGHTRYPLCIDNLDNCLGIIHIKDLLRYNGDLKTLNLKEIKRDIIRVKHNDDLVASLTKLRRNKMHMAVVEDEFGGTIGILTIEDILEEIVGQIKDEFDAEEINPQIKNIEKNTYKISGLMPLHEVEDLLNVDFENDQVSTFGGLITQYIGRFPEKNETIFFEDQNLRVIIDDVESRRIVECTVEFIKNNHKDE